MSGDNHPMHPLVDADGHITATGETFIQRAGEIMDETVAKSVTASGEGRDCRNCNGSGVVGTSDDYYLCRECGGRGEVSR